MCFGAHEFSSSIIRTTTGATAPIDLYAEAVSLCRRHGILLLSDLAYSELTFDGLVAPSALQVPGAKDVTIEFHSFSKTFNMAGSRIGFAVGSRHLIDTLNAIRTNMGYGTPVAIQTGAAYALDHFRELEAPTVARYESRRHALIEGFRSLGWTQSRPARRCSSGSPFLPHSALRTGRNISSTKPVWLSHQEMPLGLEATDFSASH